ncbi:hypothetical protein KUTeg_010161 [Tegillarca granosa]|uniref:Uncharacterized protein n=1 Tax=Tegillarca granosa TaxID=220873 RepID=A0ABQ9F5Y2_TEGGR|nr:hypothetical protein KUTeg_010161 [Tegillarca granosa]
MKESNSKYKNKFITSTNIIATLFVIYYGQNNSDSSLSNLNHYKNSQAMEETIHRNKKIIKCVTSRL